MIRAVAPVGVDVVVQSPTLVPDHSGEVFVGAEISIADFDAIIREDLPWAYEIGMHADAIDRGRAALRLPFRPSMLRPGGVVSGPIIMALADACMFAVVLSAIGKVKLAVTTSFSINFLYGASPADLLAEGTMLRLGKRLAVMQVTVHSEGHQEPIAHATGTYSLPPHRGRDI